MNEIKKYLMNEMESISTKCTQLRNKSVNIQKDSELEEIINNNPYLCFFYWEMESKKLFMNMSNKSLKFLFEKKEFYFCNIC